MDQATILWGLVFGSVGLGYFIYGKKQKNPVALGSGLLLMGMPYVVTDVVYMLIAGFLTMIAPVLLKNWL